MAADEPLTAEKLVRLFKQGEVPIDELRQAVRDSLEMLAQECEGRGFELKKVASGYRFQVRQELSEWVSRLWEEKPGRYSRAFLETLALIAYKQPLTRADIEQVRGVAVSPNIIRTLMERNWIRIVGTRDTPGKPSLYGTTKEFLDYFNLAGLGDLPPLAEIRSLLEGDDGDDGGDGNGAGTTEGAAAEEVPDGDSGEMPGISVELSLPDPLQDEADAAQAESDPEHDESALRDNVVQLPGGRG
ncbi:MAG: SMC-Scp complex subunit ScpB [Pseudomonadales bacterium]